MCFCMYKVIHRYFLKTAIHFVNYIIFLYIIPCIFSNKNEMKFKRIFCFKYARSAPGGEGIPPQWEGPGIGWGVLHPPPPSLKQKSDFK